MMEYRIMRSAVTENPELNATIIPWSDYLHTYMGCVYIFHDERKPNRLVYMAPKENAEMLGIHLVSDVELIDDGYGVIVKLPDEDRPDPERDRWVTDISVALE